MKKALYCLAALAALTIVSASRQVHTDAAELVPVQLFIVDAEGGQTIVTAETGEKAAGTNLDEALSRLRAQCAGQLFTKTAEHIVLTERAWYLMPQVCVCRALRPAARLYRAQQQAAAAPEKLLSYLQAHPGELTLSRVRAALLENEVPAPPQIHATEGGLSLER